MLSPLLQTQRDTLTELITNQDPNYSYDVGSACDPLIALALLEILNVLDTPEEAP